MARGWGALIKWIQSFDDNGASPSAWGPLGGTGPAGPQGAVGPQGPGGATGPAGAAGPAGLNWKGAWDAATAYILNDSVGRNGASWFATGAAAAGIDPNPSGDGHTAQAPWQLLAAQGAQGPAGAAGAQGPTGPTGATGPAGTAITSQSNTLPADAAGLAAASSQNAFLDNFAVGTYLVTFQCGITPTGAGNALIAAWMAAGTATVAFHGPTGAQITSGAALNCNTVKVTTIMTVSVAGTIAFVGWCAQTWTMKQFFNEGANEQATAYSAVKIA